MALLEVEQLKVQYDSPAGRVRAVDVVSFSLDEGAALGIVGESGCGKSSLALALMRLLPPNVALFSGEVRLDGADISGLDDESFRQLRWQKLALVFQGAMESFNPVLKVGEQVIEPLLQRGTGRAEAEARGRELLEAVLLPARVFDRYPHELSGGMKQRALIAMALVLRPRLLVMDEPTSALDVIAQAEVMNLLKRLKAELKIGILFITHDIALSSDISDHIGVMYAGEIVELGPADNVLVKPGHPYVQKLLGSVPRLGSDKGPEFIKGTPPNLVSPPPGCRFHPRCPYAFAPCFTEPPPYLPANSHQATCWLLKK